jgi:hypothetical protein
MGLYVTSVDDVEETEVIRLSEDVLNGYQRIMGVLLEVDKRGTVVLGSDRKDEWDEFFSLSEENSLDLEEDFVYLTLGEKQYRVLRGLYGGAHSQPTYLILAAVFGCIALIKTFHFYIKKI